MQIEKTLQKTILDEARIIAGEGKIPNVRELCDIHFYPVTSSHRNAVAELLDKAGIKRRKQGGRGRAGKATKATISPSDFGAKFEALNQVFVEVSKPSSDIDLFLVERAKAGNARALEILKKLVG